MKQLYRSAIVSLCLLWAPAAFATTCQTLLDNHSYDCEGVNELKASFTFCATFTSPGTGVANSNINYRLDTSNFTGSCSCLASGTFTLPKFNASTHFDCITTDEIGDIVNLAATVGSTGITSGQTTANNGFSTIFKCTRRSSAC